MSFITFNWVYTLSHVKVQIWMWIALIWYHIKKLNKVKNQTNSLKTKLNLRCYNPLKIRTDSAHPCFLDRWPWGAIQHMPGQVVSLTLDPRFLFPKLALYSFHRHRRDKRLSEPCLVRNSESNCAPVAFWRNVLTTRLSGLKQIVYWIHENTVDLNS